MAQATDLRRDISTLTERARAELRALWAEVETPEDTETVLRDLLPALIVSYGAIAAMVAANWYDAAREVAAVRRAFTATPIEIPDVGAQSLVGWALSEAKDMPAFVSLVEGGTQRRIANHSRLTVTQSSIQDPAASGWVRVGRGGCDWCAKYIDGEIRTVAYDFPAHDNCLCQAIPAF